MGANKSTPLKERIENRIENWLFGYFQSFHGGEDQAIPTRIKKRPAEFSFLVKSLGDIEAGDHIAVYREKGFHGKVQLSGIYHHGVYNDNGMVIDFDDKGVNVKTYQDFHKGDKVFVIKHPDASLDVTRQRALSALQYFKTKYNPLTYNCEHFALEMVTGKPRSAQVERIDKRVGRIKREIFGRIVMRTHKIKMLFQKHKAIDRQ